ncbi:MAG TPA: homoserine dehydrogenase [Gemmatimonadaceae bacterium]|nr:homoserine dehydrogenase [Gemmatimonadaceae bacterium]
MTSVAEVRRDVVEPWGSTRTVRVALAGCGAVGSALLRALDARQDALARRFGRRVEITRVLVRDLGKQRAADLDHALLTTRLDDFLASEPDVVIEAIGGLDPARRIAEWALCNGRELVTANKELLAAHGTALHALARQHGGTLRYDAAVGGGVPVLRLLDDALGAGTPSRVRGILNGTTNYVLGRLERGCSLDDALVAARDAGFAEADASRDLDGRDAAAKIALVAWAAYGVAPESLDVGRRSLLPDPARYVRLAQRVGGVVRQVAECALTGSSLAASVEPVIVSPASALGRVRDEQNHVEVDTGWSAPLTASGPGAGGAPTATALLADFVCTARPPVRDGVAGCGPDLRTSDWAIEVVGAPRLLHRAVPKCGLVYTDHAATRAWTVARGLAAAEVDRVLAELRAQGGDAIAARLDETLFGDGRDLASSAARELVS